MRAFKRIVVVLAFGCIAAMVAFPPWKGWVFVGQGSTRSWKVMAKEYGFITTPPENATSVDFIRLGVQCLPFAGLIWWGTRKRDAGSQELPNTMGDK